MTATVSTNGMVELYRRYRPKTFTEMVGQDDALAPLRAAVQQKKIPHAILLAGHTGSGKTTTVRILKGLLQCGAMDYREINAANDTGIEGVRTIEASAGRLPVGGSKGRLWVLDESHRLTGPAQQCLLKLLEDPPAHAYFVLCTTDPQKLIPTVRGRCTQVLFRPIDESVLAAYAQDIASREGAELSDACAAAIAAAANGSAREALVLLQGVLAVGENEEARLKAIANVAVEAESKTLAQLLIDPKGKWPRIAALLKELHNEDAEGVRYGLLAYYSAILLGGGGPLVGRAAQVINEMSYTFVDSKRAGLILACWKLCHTK